MRNLHSRTGTKPPVLLLLSLLCLTFATGGGAATATQAGVDPRASQRAQAAPESLALRVYFRDAAERDSLAAQFGLEHVHTDDVYVTVWTDQTGYNDLLARGLRVEKDHDLTQRANSVQP